jgi:hypothetical protein
MKKKPAKRLNKAQILVPRGDAASPITGAQLQALLDGAQRSQRGTAKELDISERQMRRYVAGEALIPKVVELALLYLCGAAHRSVKSTGVSRPAKHVSRHRKTKSCFGLPTIPSMGCGDL